MKLFNIVSALLVVFIFTPKSWGVLDLIVRGEVKVYKKPNSKSRVITTLTRGDRVVISPKLYGSWRKVLVTYEGKRQGGFVKNKKIKLSAIEDRDRKENNFFRKNSSFGFNTNFIFELQSSGNVAVEGFNDAVIDTRQGFSFSLGLDYHMPVSSWGLLQISLKNKKSNLEGNAELIPGGARNLAEIKQDMISVGTFLKFYKDKSSFFWKGVGVELAKVTSVSMNLKNGANIAYNGGLPFYILASVGMGWDYHMSGKYYLLTDTRMSANFTGAPVVVGGEVMISFARIF